MAGKTALRLDFSSLGDLKSDRLLEIILGVDTHLDIHVGVVIDATGRVLGTLSVGTHDVGYRPLLSWAQTFPPVPE